MTHDIEWYKKYLKVCSKGQLEALEKSNLYLVDHYTVKMNEAQTYLFAAVAQTHAVRDELAARLVSEKEEQDLPWV